jgi:hypothetical protein
MNLRPGPGIYDTLLDQTLADLLSRYPELRTVFGKLESEEQPSRYAEFVSKVLKQSFHRSTTAGMMTGPWKTSIPGEKFCCNLIPKWLNAGRFYVIETIIEFPWNLAWLQD